MICLKTVTLKERAGLNSLRLFIFLATAVFMFFSSECFSQKKEEADSLVRLLEANSAKLQEINGISYRKIEGPARFFHNNTYLLCDTALWNVTTNIIDAIGHVQIIQENTFLRSDRIEYIINENLAQFRGEIVELFDKEGNTLKTNYLDYNTKDSIATFYNGAALINNDGNLIESINGSYYAKEKLFCFNDNVQMFADSVFIISNKIDYRTDINRAYFGNGTTAWQSDNMLFANSGDFDRPGDIFTFDKDGYILSREQEIWADLLKYYRKSGNADLFNNVQILDTVQTALALADKATYRPKPMVVELTLKPVVGLYSVEKGVRDTLFIAASDTIKYYTVKYCDIDSSTIAAAKTRRQLSDIDPIAIINAQVLAAATRRAAAAENPPGFKKKVTPLKTGKPINNTLLVKPKVANIAIDTSAIINAIKSLDVPIRAAIKLNRDTANIIKAKTGDTTQITFVDAYHNVRMFRTDLQGICDSLVYTGIDSIARFYKDPVMWNDIKNQFTADSIQVVLKNNALNKANLLSNAYIISQEDSIHYNQIKSTEMAAYFANNDLYRFDALGGASAIFYLQEDSIVTVMNQKESKLLSAKITDRKIQKIKYIEQIKSDALPVYKLPMDQQQLRGFNWRAEDRPKTRNEVTDRVIKKSQRISIESTIFPTYPYSKIYFPKRRDSLMAYKHNLDSMKTVRKAKLKTENSAIDSVTNVKKDSIAVLDDVNIQKNSDTITVVKPVKENVTRRQQNKEKQQLKCEEKRLKKTLKRNNNKAKAIITNK